MTDRALPSGVGRLTDLGNAHRLAAAAGDALRHVPGVGWIAWPRGERLPAGAEGPEAPGGPAWARDEAAAVRAGEASLRAFLVECEAAVEAARGPVREAKKRGLAPEHEDFIFAKGQLDAALAALAHARRSQKFPQVSSMLSWCETFESIRVEPSAIDSHHHLLAAPDGTIDLRDGSSRSANRHDMITRATHVRYLPGDDDVEKAAAAWEAYVFDLVRDRETVNWLHAWAGYCLTGTAREEKFCILQGPPGDGKGTFVEGLAAALGPNLSAALSPDMFVEKRGGGAKPWSLARLQGVRLARFSEADGSAKLSASLLCRVTGGEVVEAEAKFAMPFDYKPEWKLTFTANDLPHANPDARRNGLWRRLCLIPCLRPGVADENQDSRVKARWTDPLGGARGVLLWAVRGAARYYAAGRLPPRSAAMSAASERYRTACDPIGQFLTENYVQVDAEEVGKESHVDRDELYRAFLAWCVAQGERFPAAGAEVRDRLADPPWKVNCVRSRAGCGKAYRGLRAIRKNDREDPAEQFGPSGAGGEPPGEAEDNDGRIGGWRR